MLLAIKILLSQYSKTWTTLLYCLGEFFCITFYSRPHSGWLFGLLFEQTSLKALIRKTCKQLLVYRFKCWHLFIFPGSFPPSIFSASELNFRVRYGNGWTLAAINTNCLAPIVGLEPTTLRLTVWCSLISIIFHTSINFQKCLKTRGFWMTYKINNVYYLTYVYRFCSQFCSQNNFRDFKLEPMTIRKIHLCSYIN